MEMGARGPVVLLFVGLTCSQFENKLSLQGSTLCKWYANPPIPEAIALEGRCTGRINPPIWHGPGAAQLNPERITVAELAKFDNPHVIFNNRYVIIAKIKKIVANQTWWYAACQKCNRAAQPDGDKYRCSNPRCACTSAAPRYRVPVIVSDPDPAPANQKEPTVELVFFGSTAEEIIGTSAEALINAEGGTGVFLPTRITELYGRQFELRVSVSRASLQRTDITYQVDGIVRAANTPLLTLPAGNTYTTGLTQQDQQAIAQHDAAASSSFQQTTGITTETEHGITASLTSDPQSNTLSQDPALPLDQTVAKELHTPAKESAQSDKQPTATSTPVQITPAISEKRDLKRKAPPQDDTEGTESSSSLKPGAVPKARRRLLAEETP